MKLESSIRELHEMFMDMAMLVESQVISANQSISYIRSLLGLDQMVDFTIQPNKNNLLYYSAKYE